MDDLFFSVMVLALLPLSVIMTITGNGDLLNSVDDEWHWVYVLIEQSPCFKTEQEKQQERMKYWTQYQEVKKQWFGKVWAMESMIREIDSRNAECQNKK